MTRGVAGRALARILRPRRPRRPIRLPDAGLVILDTAVLPVQVTLMSSDATNGDG